MKIDYNDKNLFYIGDTLRCDDEGVISLFLEQNICFLNNCKTDTGNDILTVYLNCSDVFAWGCSDAETITYDDILPLYLMYREPNNKVWGTTKWVCQKRNEKPQKAVEQRMRDCGAWDDMMESLNENGTKSCAK